MKKQEENKPYYFMDLDLPVYGKIGLIEGKGQHYFNALENCKLDMNNFMKHLVLELLVVDGKKVTEAFL